MTLYQTRYKFNIYNTEYITDGTKSIIYTYYSDSEIIRASHYEIINCPSIILEQSLAISIMVNIILYYPRTILSYIYNGKYCPSIILEQSLAISIMVNIALVLS